MPTTTVPRIEETLDEFEIDFAIGAIDWGNGGTAAEALATKGISCQNTGVHCETSISPSPCGNTYLNLAMCVPCR